MTWFWRSYWSLLILIVSYVSLCALDYAEPVKHHTFRVKTPVVMQGDNLKIWMKFSRLRVCALDRTRYVIDGDGRWREVYRKVEPATGDVDPEDEIEVNVPIGRDFAPGDAYYRVILAYRCPLQLGPFTAPNILQAHTPIVVTIPDLPFTIAPAPKS